MAIKTCTSCKRPVITPHVYGSGKETLCPPCEALPAPPPSLFDSLGEWSAEDEEAAAEVALILGEDEDDEA